MLFQGLFTANAKRGRAKQIRIKQRQTKQSNAKQGERKARRRQIKTHFEEHWEDDNKPVHPLSLSWGVPIGIPIGTPRPYYFKRPLKGPLNVF